MVTKKQIEVLKEKCLDRFAKLQGKKLKKSARIEKGNYESGYLQALNDMLKLS